MSTTDQAKTPLLRRLESLTAVAVLGMLALAVGLAAFVLPTTKTQTRKIEYTQSGAFGYSGTAAQSSVYGPQGLTTGEPILTRLVPTVQGSFTYRAHANGIVRLHGTASMVVTVTVAQGLSRRFVVTRAQQFAGPHTVVVGALPMTDIEAYVRTAQGSLGVGASGLGDTATVVLQPRVVLAGDIDEHAVSSSFAPKLSFTFNGSTLNLTSDQTAPPSAGGTLASMLRPTKNSAVRYETATANTMSLVVAHPTVRSTRVAALGLAGFCLLLALWLARPLMRGGRRPADADRIKTLYGSLLTPITTLSATARANSVIADVASIDALAALAKRYEAQLMHLHHNGEEGRCGDTYFVWDNGILYRYQANVVATAAADAADNDVVVAEATRVLIGS